MSVSLFLRNWNFNTLLSESNDAEQFFLHAYCLFGVIYFAKCLLSLLPIQKSQVVWTFIINLKEWFFYRRSSCSDTHIVNMFCSLWLVLLTSFQVFIFVNMNLSLFSFIIRLFGSFLRNTVCMLSRFSHVRHFATPLITPPGSSAHGILQARILEWVTIPFSRGSSQPRDQTWVFWDSCIAGGFFTAEPPGKPLLRNIISVIKIFFLSFFRELKKKFFLEQWFIWK